MRAARVPGRCGSAGFPNGIGTANCKPWKTRINFGWVRPQADGTVPACEPVAGGARCDEHAW